MQHNVLQRDDGLTGRERTIGDLIQMKQDASSAGSALHIVCQIPVRYRRIEKCREAKDDPGLVTTEPIIWLRYSRPFPVLSNHEDSEYDWGRKVVWGPHSKGS